MPLATPMNAMIDLTNAICNHYAPLCHWWTLNHWPRCQFFCKCKHFTKTKCDASLNFHFLMQMLPTKMQKFLWYTCLITNMQMQISMMQMRLLYDANFPYKDANIKFIYDDANAHLRRCGCKSLFFDIKMPLVGMSWCECPLVGVPWCKWSLVGMSRCKCFLLDANAI